MGIARPLARNQLARAIAGNMLPPSGGGGAPSLTAQVQALFAKYSAAGGMWDFTDMATLFQDDAGTTPVTASGQSIGRANDLSGLGNYMRQDTFSLRPLFNSTAGCVFDGVDDQLYVSGIAQATGDTCTVAAAVDINSTYGVLAYGNNTNTGWAGCWHAGSTSAVVENANSPFTIYASGAVIGNNRNDYYNALTGTANQTDIAFTAANDWGGWLKIGSYPGFVSPPKYRRLFYFNKALSVDDRAIVRAWCNEVIA